jgi:hypothetical protein
MAAAILAAMDEEDHPDVAERASMFNEENAVRRYMEIMHVTDQRDVK